jgi:hypothetical protein
VKQPQQPTPFKKFEDALRKVLSAPKSEVDKRIKEEKKSRTQGKRKD